jgi:hypothetical protein
MRAFLVVTLLVGVGSPAHAAPDPTSNQPILVFESHVGDRPAEFGRFMTTLADELEARGFAARSATILRVAGAGMPRPGILDKDRAAGRVVQDVDAAHVQLTSGEYDDAVKTAAAAIESMRRNPALFATDTSNTDVMFKAQATLALGLKKRGDAARSVAAMSELIRMFPSRPLPRNIYGPSDETFYREVLKQVQAQGRGRLSIAGGDSRAVIFVDGQIRGIGTTNLADLIPGVYHVFVQVPQTIGRHYEIVVAANDDSYLNVQHEIDAALWVTDAWIGFRFASEADRQKEARFIREVARRWSRGSKVAMIGTMTLHGQPAVIGTVYGSTGTALLSAVIALPEVNDAKLRDLARFLAEGTPAAGLRIVKGSHAGVAAAVPSTRPSRLVPASLLASGIAALTTGIVLIAIDQDRGAAQPLIIRDTAPLGVAIVSGGTLLTVAAVIVWARRGARVVPTIAALPVGGTVGFAGRF